MSQIYKSTGSGPPPTLEVTFVTDDGTVISMADIVNYNGVDSTEDNVNGILTRANPNNSNNMEVVLTNRLMGTATVVGNVTGDIVTFALGSTDAVYRFNFEVTGRDTTTQDGVGYTVFGSVKTDGATSTVIASPFVDNDEDASLLAASMTIVASGNNAILQATGVAGQTISFKAVGSYVVV